MGIVRAVLLIGAVFLAACDQAGTSTELSRPSTAPTQLIPFNGTLALLGTNTHVFTVLQDGYVEVTLVGLGAPSGTKVGLAIGTPSVIGTCEPNQSVTAAAGAGAQLVGTGIAGRLCVTITDVGNLAAPAVYTITVASS
jgi:hypothetical protein